MKKRVEKLDKELEGYWIKNNDKDNGKYFNESYQL